MKKAIIITCLSFVVFLALIYYNYRQTQKAISEEKTTVTQVESVSYPESIQSGSKASLVWRVTAPTEYITPYTTLYWSYESSPSALHQYDSPQAVGYPNHPGDYESGEFPLPSDFSVSIAPDKVGKVYFRSYALVRGSHLWSAENSFIVTSKSNDLK